MKNTPTLLCAALLFGSCATTPETDVMGPDAQVMTPAAPGGGAAASAEEVLGAFDGKVYVVLFVEAMGPGWNEGLSKAVTQHVRNRVLSHDQFELVSQEVLDHLGPFAMPSTMTMSPAWLDSVRPMFGDWGSTVFMRVGLHLDGLPEFASDGSVLSMPQFTVATQCVDVAGERRCENVLAGGLDEHLSLIEYAVRDLHGNALGDVLAAPMR